MEGLCAIDAYGLAKSVSPKDIMERIRLRAAMGEYSVTYDESINHFVWLREHGYNVRTVQEEYTSDRGDMLRYKNLVKISWGERK
jgi:hypothetical protein